MLRSMACENRPPWGSHCSLGSSMHPEGAAGHTRVDSGQVCDQQEWLPSGVARRLVAPSTRRARSRSHSRGSIVAPEDAPSTQDEVTAAARSSPDRGGQRRTICVLVEPPARRCVGQHVQRDLRATAAWTHKRNVPEVSILPDGIEGVRQQLVGLLGEVDDSVRGRGMRRRR
jgi:hypothetical protein